MASRNPFAHHGLHKHSLGIIPAVKAVQMGRKSLYPLPGLGRGEADKDCTKGPKNDEALSLRSIKNQKILCRVCWGRYGAEAWSGFVK